MFIVISGGPIEGFKFYGPFATEEEATLADVKGDFWVAELLDPQEPSE